MEVVLQCKQPTHALQKMLTKGTASWHFLKLGCPNNNPYTKHAGPLSEMECTWFQSRFRFFSSVRSFVRWVKISMPWRVPDDNTMKCTIGTSSANWDSSVHNLYKSDSKLSFYKTRGTLSDHHLEASVDHAALVQHVSQHILTHMYFRPSLDPSTSQFG